MKKRYNPQMVCSGGAVCLVLVALALAGCSKQPDGELAAGERPDAPVTDADPTAQFVEEQKVEPPPLEEKVPCPFAADIKKVVLRDMVERLEGGIASPEALYFFQDETEGEAVVQALGDLEATVVGTVVPMIMQAGIPVERDSGRPIVLCAVEIDDWSEDEVDAVGIWLVDDQTQGNDPYRLVRQDDAWIVSDAEDE